MQSKTTSPLSSRCKITTRSSIAKKSARCFPHFVNSVLDLFLGLRWLGGFSRIRSKRQRRGQRQINILKFIKSMGTLLIGGWRFCCISCNKLRALCSVEEVGKKKGISMAQVAMAWILAKPGVTAPIVGTTSLQNLKDLIGTLPTSSLCDARLTGDRIRSR